MSIRIVLADDHTIVRYGLSRAFEQETDINVVGLAQNGLSAVGLVRDLSPDAVVMDISMPDLNGIEATHQILKISPRVKVVALSMHSSDKYVREMFRAGASAYLLKDCPFEELVEAIKMVIDGKTYVSPSISGLVINDYLGKSEGLGGSAFAVLSRREREVLQLLAEGNTTKEVGKRLHISPKTVEVHRIRIMNKLDIDNIAQLTKYAIQEGLTQADP
jgi:DNA-binding NarL/FixJ family response regulator